MPPRVYVETSVISYLAARPSRDLVTVARQQITHDWWRRRRPHFEVFVSQLVLDEARAGDPEAATRRADLLADLPLVEITSLAVGLARRLIEAAGGLPQRAGADALHIATAACHGLDYLLTWTAAHIANAEYRPRVERTCRAHGYEPPVLCTPDELMGEETAGD
jgi:predicted nucleic acid-binding protein